MRIFFVFALALGVVCSCTEDDPKTNDNIDGGSDTEDGGATSDCSDVTYEENIGECTPGSGDYLPRENGSVGDTWAECISDDNAYHRVEPDISSIERVKAYDAIAAWLWDNPSTPSAKDFIDARVLFEDEQGLGSRIARRYDVHYPRPAVGGCEDEGVPAANPDYCVGPALLQPIIVEAFADGASGNNSRVNAAKIEAALQWFFYVSAIKEATTCADAAKDCDSAWAYYCGGTDRESPIGLAADIDSLAPGTHDSAYDGVLAVRCWRDLDRSVPAEDLELRDRAIDQLDKALLRGMAVLVRQRFAQLLCKTGDEQGALVESLRILVPLLDRETSARNSEQASFLMEQIEKNAGEIDVQGALESLDSIYLCP